MERNSAEHLEQNALKACNDKGFKPFFTRNRGGSGTASGRFPYPKPPLRGGVGGMGNHPPEPSPSAGREDRAAWVRLNLPICAAVASEFAAVFPGCRMTFASEAGHTVGKPTPAGVRLSDTAIGGLSDGRQVRDGKRSV